MSKIRANQITNENCNGAPTFTNGLNSSGIITSTTTATTFSGNLTVTGNLGASGTLTYEDVSSIDSVGIITARSGVKVDLLRVLEEHFLQMDHTILQVL